VPVIKVRLTDSAPILDKAGLVMHHGQAEQRDFESAPESTHQEWGESPHRTEALVCP